MFILNELPTAKNILHIKTIEFGIKYHASIGIICNTYAKRYKENIIYNVDRINL